MSHIVHTRLSASLKNPVADFRTVSQHTVRFATSHQRISGIHVEISTNYIISRVRGFDDIANSGATYGGSTYLRTMYCRFMHINLL